MLFLQNNSVKIILFYYIKCRTKAIDLRKFTLKTG